MIQKWASYVYHVILKRIEAVFITLLLTNTVGLSQLARLLLHV